MFAAVGTQFEDAWSRYLLSDPPQASHAATDTLRAGLSQATRAKLVTDGELASEPGEHSPVTLVTLPNAEAHGADAVLTNP